MQWKAQLRASAGATGALLVLSGLWAIGALQADLLPHLMPVVLPPLERQALPLALLAVMVGSVALLHRVQGHFWVLFQSAFPIATGLFLAPSALLHFSQSGVPSLMRTALFTLVPVFAIVFEPHMGSGEGRRPRNAIIAGLTGVVGAFLVFPAGIPESFESALSFAAIVIAAASVAWSNCRAVRVLCEFPSESRVSLAVLIAGLAAAELALGSVAFERPIFQWSGVRSVLFWSIAVEVPGLLLLFWLMGRMSATRMTTRFVFSPLLAILMGVVLLQSVTEVRLRTWVGLALMAAGAGWLLLARDEKDASPERISLNGSPR